MFPNPPFQIVTDPNIKGSILFIGQNVNVVLVVDFEHLLWIPAYAGMTNKRK